MTLNRRFGGAVSAGVIGVFALGACQTSTTGTSLSLTTTNRPGYVRVVLLATAGPATTIIATAHYGKVTVRRSLHADKAGRATTVYNVPHGAAYRTFSVSATATRTVLGSTSTSTTSTAISLSN